MSLAATHGGDTGVTSGEVVAALGHLLWAWWLRPGEQACAGAGCFVLDYLCPEIH